MKIDEYFHNNEIATQLEAVNALFDQAQVNVTFLGRRVLVISNYEGSISLDKVADKILQAALKRFDDDDLNIYERIEGFEIADKLCDFYRSSDVQMMNTNRFTRLLAFIYKELYFLIYFAPNRIEEDIRTLFSAYSEKKYLQGIGEEKISFKSYLQTGGYISGINSPFKVIVSEEEIRAIFSW